MPDCILHTPDPALVLGPGDELAFLGFRERMRRGRVERAALYAVVHRRSGVWTHVYRVIRGAGARRSEVFLLKVLSGMRIDDARAWARNCV